MPFLNEQVRLHVSDNCSTDLRYLELSEQFNNSYIKITRNAHNLGIVGNILKGFTLVENEFLWVLSDDDEIKPENISEILKAIELNPSHIYLKANISGEINLLFDHYTSREEILWTFSSASMTGLISANIYNLKLCSKFVEAGYRYGNTLFPHSAIFYSTLAKTEGFDIRVVKNVVNWNFGEITYPEIHDVSWTHYLDLSPILPAPLRKIFVRKFLQDWGKTHLFLIFMRSNEMRRYFFYVVNYPQNAFDFFSALMRGFVYEATGFLKLSQLKQRVKRLIKEFI